MRCRNIVLNSDGTYNIVWFGKSSYTEKADNYVERQENVAKSLIQRLAVIEGELWYNTGYGLPLMDKIKNKAILDVAVINIINDHPEVLNILTFESTTKQETRSYHLSFSVSTIYGNTVSISTDYSI